MNILWLICIALILRIRLLYGQTEYSGKTVEPGEYPFVVEIILHDSASNTFHCSGSIISPNWVLTSASCTGYAKGEIQHGAWWANKTQILVPVSDSMKHPEFTGTVMYSVGLLRTQYPLKFDSFTQAVRLIPQTKPVPININALAIAWTSDKDLEVYNSTLLEEREWNNFVAAPSFVYRHKSLGAPLMYDGDQIGMLASEASHTPFYYNDLSINLDWIYWTITFYEYKEEYAYLKKVKPNCTGTTGSNAILDICCTYPFGHDLLDLCTSLE